MQVNVLNKVASIRNDTGLNYQIITNVIESDSVLNFLWLAQPTWLAETFKVPSVVGNKHFYLRVAYTRGAEVAVKSSVF